MATDTRTLKVVVVGDSTSAQRSIRDVGREADTLKGKSGALSVALGSLAATGVSKLLDLGASAVTLGIKTASGMQQSQVAFTNMLGSGQKATAFLQQLSALAASTPFELPDRTRAAQRLMAMGIAAKDVIPTLTAAGDAVAAMGGNAQTVDQITTALGQMQAKGHVAGDEIMQMTEAGIPAVKILAAEYGKTVPEMQKMISKNEVLSSVAIPKLIDGIENGTKSTQKFGGMMSAQSETLAGKWSTLSDTVSMGLGNMFTKAMPQLNAGIDFLSNTATKVFSGIPGIIGPVATFIKNLFVVDIIPAAKDMWTVVGPLITQLGDVLKAVWDKAQPLKGITAIFDGIRAAFGFIAANKEVFQTLAVSIAAATAAYNLYVIATNAGTIATKAIAVATAAWDAIMKLSTIGLIVAAIAALVAGLIYAYTHFEGFRKVVDTVWAAIKTATAAVVDWFMAYVWPTLQTVFEALKTAVMFLVDLWVAEFNIIKTVVQAVVQFFMSYVWPTLQTIFNALKAAVMFLVDLWVAEFNIIKTVVQAVVQFFMSYVWPGIKGVFDFIAGAVKILYGAFQIGMDIITIAVKAVVFVFMNYVWPQIKAIFDLLAAAVHVLYTAFQAAWGLIETAVRAVVEFFLTYVWPQIKSVWDLISAALKVLSDVFSTIWNAIKSAVSAVVNWFHDTAWPILSAGFELIKAGITTLWNSWKSIFDSIKEKVDTVMKGAVSAFDGAQKGIASVWDKLKEAAKAPVNFVIETVYDNGIRAFWNNIAKAIGDTTQLPFIPKLAGGREVPSVPGIVGDWVPFYGQAGEYVLNRKQVAMAGGRAGIESLFGVADRSGASSGQYGDLGEHYAGGGILGGLANAASWLVDKGSELVKGSILTVAEPVINAIKAAIGTIPGAGEIAGMVRKMPTILLDKMLAYIKPKDVAPADGAAGPIGAVGVIPAWVTAARDHSSFGHNSGVGAWLFNVVKAAGLASTNYGIFEVRNTATGNKSMHGYGRAVDLPPSMATFNFLRANYGSRLKELIYSPAGGAQIYNGQNHMYTGITRDMHFSHVHASYDEGGILPPGTTIAHNGTGRNEYVMTGSQLGGPQVTVNVTVQGSVMAERDLAESISTSVRDALVRKANRNGGRLGI